MNLVLIGQTNLTGTLRAISIRVWVNISTISKMFVLVVAVHVCNGRHIMFWKKPSSNQINNFMKLGFLMTFAEVKLSSVPIRLNLDIYESFDG
ncbi:hypothetical protein Csa_022832 [Cucumis sativus]|uniref:Uncharacterized protein n=1 Tax=Cucumis sativus TaxID=3659 RepID=A0A0A0LXX9_CUCSA|nr:hypothetical protein Csa_022832 [Cucumis sativus]